MFMQRRLVSVVAAAFVCVVATSAFARKHVIDANGNSAGPGVVVSHKTGATARVGWQYASTFQAYIDDLEARGAAVKFMGGIRRGHCGLASMHPCGKALDVCQTGRGRVDRRCNLPSRQELGRIAEAHGLFEGGRWCSSDYGHAQVGVTAAACGSRPVMMAMSARARSQQAYVDPVFPARLTEAH
jgi:hypothetical protein